MVSAARMNSTFVRFKGSNNTERPFRIAGPSFGLWATNCSMATLQPTKACPVPGSDAQTLGFLLEFLKIDYEIVPFYPPESVDWGSPLGNGSYSGILGEVLNGTLDTVSSSWFMTPERQEAFGFTYPLKGSRFGYIARVESGNSGNSLFLAFKSFAPDMWVAVVATFLSLVSVLLTLQSVQDHGLRRPAERKARRSFFRLFSFFFDHGPYDMRQDLHAGHICLVCFRMLNFFVATLYSSSLLSQLLTPNIGLPFDSVEAMAGRLGTGEFRMYGYSSAFAYWRNYESSPARLFQIIRNATEAYPPVFLPDNDITLDKMAREGGMVKPASESVASELLMKRCSLDIFFDSQETSQWLAFILPPDSPYEKPLSDAILHWRGYLKWIEERYANLQRRECSAEPPAEVPLKITNLGGLFMFLLTGQVLGILYFSVEMFRLKMWRQKTKETGSKRRPSPAPLAESGTEAEMREGEKTKEHWGHLRPWLWGLPQGGDSGTSTLRAGEGSTEGYASSENFLDWNAAQHYGRIRLRI